MLAQARRVEMHEDVDGDGRRDQPFAIAHCGRRRYHEPRVDAVHDGRVAGLAEADDPPAGNAEIAFHDTENRIDDGDIAQQQIERAAGAGHAGRQPDAVTQRLAAAMQTLVAVDGVILLDDRDQRGVGELDAVTDRRAVHGGIVAARNFYHHSSFTGPAVAY